MVVLKRKEDYLMKEKREWCLVLSEVVALLEDYAEFRLEECVDDEDIEELIFELELSNEELKEILDNHS